MSRHQVYVRLPAEGKTPPKVIGISQEYLYGKKVLSLLTKFLHTVECFLPNDNLAKKHSTAVWFLKGFYSKFPMTDIAGEIKDELVEDPRKTWNNSGITVIDLSGDTIKYCFLSVLKIECDYRSDWTFKKVRHPNDPDHGQELWYENFLPITATHWIQLHHGKDFEAEFLMRNGKEAYQDIASQIKFLDKFKLMDVTDLALMFPKMVTEVQGTGIVTTPNTLRFLDLTTKPIVIKATSTSGVKIKSSTPRKSI